MAMKRFPSCNPKQKEVFTPLVRRTSVSTATAALHPLLQGPQKIDSERCVPLRVASKYCLTEFTRRVMSGKLLQLRQYQNLLGEAQRNLQAATEENRSLNRLLKRYEASLRRYEGEDAGMPRLIRAHAEEVRALRIQVQQLKKESREAQMNMREKDNEVLALKDVIAKLKSLVEQKSLLDLEKANRKINRLEALNEEQNREVQGLKRRILIETKTNQRLLDSEMSKHKETKEMLQQALDMIELLEKQKKIISMGYTPINGIKHHECQLPNSKSENSIRPRRGSLLPLEPPNGGTSVRKSPTNPVTTSDHMSSKATRSKTPSFTPHKPQRTPII